MDILQVTIAGATFSLAALTALMWWSTRSVATATAALSQRTADLAQKTSDLATETLAATRLADRHHQEAMTPLLVLEDGYVESRSGQLRVTGKLRNIGLGLAIRARISIGSIGQPIDVGPIAAGGERSIECGVVTTDVRHEMPIIVGTLYENIFEREARTEHHGRCHVRASFNTVFFPAPIVERIA